MRQTDQQLYCLTFKVQLHSEVQGLRKFFYQHLKVKQFFFEIKNHSCYVALFQPELNI